MNPDISSSFADRDMLMRYHWGLAVGHVYSHRGSQPAGQHGPDSNIAVHVDVGHSAGTSYSRSISEEYGPDIEPDYAGASHLECAFDSVDEDLELGMEDLEDDLGGFDSESDTGDGDQDIDDLESMALYGVDESGDEC